MHRLLAGVMLGLILAGAASEAEAGPASARGLVIFTVADQSAAPPPLVRLLGDDGWDVIVNPVAADFTHEREIGRALFEMSRREEAKGYAKVVLVGESFGAWVSLLANSSWTTPIDGGRLHAVIALDASAAALDGAGDGRWHEYKFINVLKSQDATRLAVFLYDGEAGETAARQDEIVRSLRNHVRFPVVSVEAAAVAGPDGPRGEGFARRWGGCLKALLDADDDGPAPGC